MKIINMSDIHGDFGTFLELEIDKDLFVTPRKIYKVNIGSVKTKQFEEVEV